MAKKLHKYFKVNEELFYSLIVSICGASIIGLFNRYYILPLDQTLVYRIVNIFAVIVLVTPPTIVRYANYNKLKTIEERFPDFLRDIVEGLRGGMSLPLAIKYTSKNNYSALTPKIKLLISQLSWGVPFEKAINNFASTLNSKTITRAVRTIIEAHRSGGNIADVIDAVGTSTVELEKIKRERTSRISSQMMQGYIIYFVFLGVMIGIQKFLIPSFSGNTGASTGALVGAVGGDADITSMMLGSTSNTVINVEDYEKIFSHLAVIQGFFSGVVIGKLAEGSVDAGLKHAIILVIIGYTVMTLATGI
ncbi:hypothetical protein GQ473_01515 [archaeon]|nr:hypothetical protein [archaeon]